MSEGQQVDALAVFRQMSDEEQAAFLKKLSPVECRRLRRMFSDSLLRCLASSPIDGGDMDDIKSRGAADYIAQWKGVAYTHAKLPKVAFKGVSLEAFEGTGTIELVIEGEGISIGCTVSISREDAFRINRAFHAWHQAVESLNDDDLTEDNGE